MEVNQEEVNLNGEDIEIEEAVETVEEDTNWNPELEMLFWMFQRDILGMDEGEGRDIVIAASDGTEFVAHTSKLYKLFHAMILKGDTLKISMESVNFRFLEDGPTTKALLAFLDSNDKSLMEESSRATLRLLMFGFHYQMEDLTAATIQVLMEKIGTDVEFDDPEFLWVLNTWIVNQTDRNNGEVPPEYVALKTAISRVFNRKVANSRKQRIRSPAASQNMFGSFWQMNVNLLL